MDFDFDQINQMIGSLSEEDMEQLQQAAQIFGTPKEEAEPAVSGSEGFSFDPAMIGKISQMMDAMKGNDSRTELILALKPHLSRRRQRRAEEAMRMMKMLELLPTLKNGMNF